MADRRDGRWQAERRNGDGRVDRQWTRQYRDRDEHSDREQHRNRERGRDGRSGLAGSKRALDSGERRDDSRQQHTAKHAKSGQAHHTHSADDRWRPQEEAEAEEGELRGAPHHGSAQQQQPDQQPLHPTQSIAIDSDDEEAAVEREWRERQERTRRRADILTKHAQQPASQTAQATSAAAAGALPADASGSTQSEEQPVEPTASDHTASSAREFDMFADSPSLLLSRPQSATTAAAVGAESAAGASSELLDSWDDAEGYYKYRLGDVLTDGSSGRQYRVCGLQGGGVFSTVLLVKPEGAALAEDSQRSELVVKVIRNNETMYKAGVKEVDFLTRIASTSAQPASAPAAPPRRHIVQLLHHFQHRSHLCLVFPPYAMDLRKVIKKFGSVGLSLPAVRVYAAQLLTALRHLVRAGVVHGDIKPDNILVSERLNECALCDFGSASYLADCSITPYLVSRFYRAPEIMLGCEYGFGIDTWSVGCVLYELYTGRILFDGRDNNDMLHKIQQLRGDFPPRLVRRAAFAARHFDADGRFCVERSDVNGGVYRQSVPAGQQRDLHTDMRRFRGAEAKDDKGTRKLRRLAELILLCLTVDPARRPSVDELVKQPFIAEE